MAKKTTKRKTPTKSVKKETDSSVKTSIKTQKPASQELKETLNTQNRSIITGVIVLLIILAGAFLIYTKHLVAAYVNGQPISRLEVISQLEKQNGKTVLSQLVTEKLITQEAQKKNITVSQAEIDKELKTVEASLSQQGMTIDQALQAQGMTKAELNDQVKIQLLVQKMVPTPKVSDKDVDNYISKNPDQITPGQETDTTFRDSVKSQLVQQQQQTSVQKFITDLQSKAKIDTVIKY